MGVHGEAEGSGDNYGVYGKTYSTVGTGVWGYASSPTGLTVGVGGAVESSSGYAGDFVGSVRISGYLTKAGGSFQIDHPLDPQNKFLNHFFVESPEMKNVYDGLVMLDGNGEAWVELPAWFEALNKDFRYQLTPIGGPAPNLHIAVKIRDNRFKIAGGSPGIEVSWHVTGARKDPWAQANGKPVEEDKPTESRGKYLHPEAYGEPKTKGIHYERMHSPEHDGPARDARMKKQ